MPRRGFTLIELLVVIAIICVLVGLLLPAVQSVREAARRSQCVNNLKELGTAIQSYALTHNVLPPGSVNPSGPIKNAAVGYHFSWITQILPYIERGNIDRKLNRSVGVYDPANQTCREVVVNVLLCPSHPNSVREAGNVAGTTYAAVHHDVEAPIDVTNMGCFFSEQSHPDRGRGRRDVADDFPRGKTARPARPGLGVGNESDPAQHQRDRRFRRSRVRLGERFHSRVRTHRRSRRRVRQRASRRLQRRVRRQFGPVHQERHQPAGLPLAGQSGRRRNDQRE